MHRHQVLNEQGLDEHGFLLRWHDSDVRSCSGLGKEMERFAVRAWDGTREHLVRVLTPQRVDQLIHLVDEVLHLTLVARVTVA